MPGKSKKKKYAAKKYATKRKPMQLSAKKLEELRIANEKIAKEMKNEFKRPAMEGWIANEKIAKEMKNEFKRPAMEGFFDEVYTSAFDRPMYDPYRDRPREENAPPRPPPMPNKKAECAEPSCNVCKQVKAREMEKLPKYYTGLRVSVAGIGPRRRMGTIINLDTVPPQATALAVCLDEPVGPDLSAPALHDIARPGYGVFVRKDNVRVSDDQHTFDAFTAVPEHVGVVVTEDTRVDSVTFKSGQTGRILAQPNGPTGRVLVNWNFNNRHFFEGWGSEVGIPRGMFMRCYNVPREMLAYCRLDGRGRVRAIWPNSSKGEKIDFKKGDFVRCVLAEPQRVSNGNRNYHISPGTIMKYQGQLDRQKSQVTLAGGCDPAIIGLPTIVATKGLEKLEEEFIDQGIEVEISATLNFRKRDLRGLHAVVVLPMDQDGEIGLQFQEDLEGAGSLDGHGQDKRCLYIHHSLVKKVSG